jgi:GDP-L-fucose synthase
MSGKTMDLSNKRILVTGGAGFLGKRVVAELLAAGANQEKISIPDRRISTFASGKIARKPLNSRI